MKRPKRYVLTYLCCLSWDVVCWLIVLGLRVAFRGSKLFWHNGLWCELPVRSWRGKVGGIIGHGGWYAKEHAGENYRIVDHPTEFHEQFHVEQYEVNMLRMFTVAVVVGAVLVLHSQLYLACWIAGLLWTTGFFTWLIPGWVQAWMRGEKAYRGSIHEEGAYAVTKEWLNED